MTIQRYDPDLKYIGTGEYVAVLSRSDYGDAVMYEDHLSAVAAVEARLAEDAKARAQLVEALKDASFAYATEVTAHGTITQRGIYRLDKWDTALAAAKERG